MKFTYHFWKGDSQMAIDESTIARRKETDLKIIDCDVHQTVKSFNDLKPYLPRTWWERLDEYSATLPNLYWRPVPLNRRDASPGQGLPPGSDPTFTKTDLLDRHQISTGILTGSFFTLSCHYNPDYASAIASAFNDYTLDTWIPSDDRWLASIIVSSQDPILAAKEIDRLGSHPKVAQVLMTTASRDLYGQRRFYPIYEAAVRNNLPIAIHVGGEGDGINPPTSAAGYPTTNFERHNILPIHPMSQLNSIVCEGVFESFPSLKVIFVECGLAWVSAIMWRMDKNFRAFRKEVPWLKRKYYGTLSIYHSADRRTRNL
jgi:predicted TIM-barrel fold metal-dependent hydrolase